MQESHSLWMEEALDETFETALFLLRFSHLYWIRAAALTKALIQLEMASYQLPEPTICQQGNEDHILSWVNRSPLGVLIRRFKLSSLLLIV